MPNPSSSRAPARIAATQKIEMPRRPPRSGRDPGTRRASVRVIVRTLDALVRAGRPETGRTPEHFLPRVRAHLDRLMRELDLFLESAAFLHLHIGPRGIRHLGESVLELRGNRGLLAAILDSGDVAEVLIKRGVRRDEIERFVLALHRSPRVPDGVNSAAASLWECDLEHVRVRGTEERLPSRPARFEDFDLANRPVERADEISADVTLEPAYTAAAEVESMPHVDLDALPDVVRRALAEADATSPVAPRATRPVATDAPSPATTGAPRPVTPDTTNPSATNATRGAVAEPFLPRGDAAVDALVRVAIAMQRAERDAGALELARELLVRILDMRMRSRNLHAVRVLLSELWQQSQHRAVAMTFRRIVGSLCYEPHVLEFGGILRRARSRPEEASVVRKILELLGETAIEPLWNLFQAAADEDERTAIGEVLIAVAWKEPTELVRYVEMRPWNEVRDLVFVLGRIGGSKVLPALRKWTTYGDSRVRIEIVRALTDNTQPAATGILCDMLGDEDYRVRQTTVWSLATRNDPSALARLKQIIFEDETFRERSGDERDDFFRTCGRLADTSTRDEFVELLQQRQLVARGWKAELRRGAALALGEIHSADARVLLERVSKTRDRRLRAACRDALSAMAVHEENAAKDPRLPAPQRRERKVLRQGAAAPAVDPQRSDATPPIPAQRSDATPPIDAERTDATPPLPEERADATLPLPECSNATLPLPERSDATPPLPEGRSDATPPVAPQPDESAPRRATRRTDAIPPTDEPPELEL